VAIVLSEAVNMKLIKDDDILVLAAVGAGFNFGASVWHWKINR
jgi:3-oxoacyl-[acyl-carrier-protein] synthase-3